MKTKAGHVATVLWIALVSSAGIAAAQPTPLGVAGDTHDLVCDTGGTLHLIYMQSGSLWYGPVEGGSVGWQELVTGSQGVTGRFGRPRLAATPAGIQLHTAWVTPDPDSDQLVHAWRENGYWQTEVVWQRSGDEHLAQPAVAVRQGGSVFLIAQRWSESSSTSPVVLYRRDAGSWGDPEELCADDREWRDTAMVADTDGGIHAVWKAAFQPGGYRYAPPGDEFGPLEEIPKRDGVDTVSFGDLTATPDGGVHHAFVTYPEPTLDLAVHPPGGAFAESTQVNTAPMLSAENNSWPAVGVDALGHVHVAWAEEDLSTETYVIRYAGYDGQAWTHLDLADDAELHTFGKVSLAVCPESVNIVWRGQGEQLVMETLEVEVGDDDSGGDDDDTSEGDDDTSGDDDSADDDTVADDDGDPPAPPDSGSDCGCRQGTPRGGATGLAVLAALGLARRRTDRPTRQ